MYAVGIEVFGTVGSAYLYLVSDSSMQIRVCLGSSG